MTLINSSTNEPYFELTFRPSVELISVVRRFVSGFFDEVLIDRDATSRLAMATHELLENAARCSTDGEVTLRIEFLGASDDIRVITWNRAGEDQLAELRAQFEAMLEITDPFAYYQQRMKQSAKRIGGSGLGLARLLSEAEMELRCEIEGDRARITGTTHAPRRERAT
jgi:hypothetical protein